MASENIEIQKQIQTVRKPLKKEPMLENDCSVAPLTESDGLLREVSDNEVDWALVECKEFSTNVKKAIAEHHKAGRSVVVARNGKIIHVAEK